MKLFQKLVCMALTATATVSLSICAFAADYTFDTAADTDYYPSTSYEDTYGTAYHYGSKNLVDYQIPELPYGVLSTTQTGVMEKLRLPGLQQTVGGSASGIYGVDSGVGIPAVTPVISSYQEPAYESEVRGSRTSDLEGLADGKPSAACQEPQNLLSKNREDRASRTAKSAFPEPQKLTPSKKEKRKIDQSHMEVRPSVRAPAQDGRTDGDAEEELLDILDGCELECFAPETALVFENAIERLFYADSFRIGNATLPQSRVRAKLRRLDGMILREAESKLRANQERNVKNSTAYTMAVLFNCIAESESDLMIDPYLNAICAAV